MFLHLAKPLHAYSPSLTSEGLQHSRNSKHDRGLINFTESHETIYNYARGINNPNFGTKEHILHGL